MIVPAILIAINLDAYLTKCIYFTCEFLFKVIVLCFDRKARETLLDYLLSSLCVYSPVNQDRLLVERNNALINLTLHFPVNKIQDQTLIKLRQEIPKKTSPSHPQ